MRSLSFVLLLLGGSVPLLAAPRDELLRLVPADYTFCLLVQNLREQGTAKTAPALQRLWQTPIVQAALRSPEGQQAQQTVSTLLKELDVTAEQLRDDVLGDAVVVAYRKGPADHPEHEDGFVFIHARDAKILAQVIDRLNDVQTKSGEVKKLETVTTKEGTYTQRTKNNAAPADGYLLDGQRLIYATRAAALKPLLAGRTPPDPAKAIESPLVKQLTTLGLNEALAVAFVNPRSFDADVQALGETTQGKDRVFLREFRTYWQALDGLTLFVRTTAHLELGVTFQVRPEALPTAAKTFFTEAGKLSPLWKSVPEDALVAAVGRFHWESFVGMFRLFLAPEDQAKIQASIADAARAFWDGDDLRGIVQGFGPDIGFCIAPPLAADKTWFPQAWLALRTADGIAGKNAEEAALAGLDFFARSACLGDKELRLHKENSDGLTVKALSHASKFPPGFRPAFAAKNGYIVVGNSPATVRRFNPSREAATTADEVPLVRFSATAWRAYLQTHRAEVARYLATVNGKDAKAMAAQLDQFAEAFTGIDRIELRQRSGAGHATLCVRVQFKD